MARIRVFTRHENDLLVETLINVKNAKGKIMDLIKSYSTFKIVLYSIGMINFSKIFLSHKVIGQSVLSELSFYCC